MQSTVADLRALVDGIADLPGEMPIVVLFDTDCGSSTALQMRGVEEHPRTAETQLVLSISEGQD